MLGLLVLAGCAETAALPVPPIEPAVLRVSDYCTIAQRIAINGADRLTEATEIAVTRHNAEWRRRCWRRP